MLARIVIIALAVASPLAAQTTNCYNYGNGFVTCTTTPGYANPAPNMFQAYTEEYIAMRERQTMLELQRQREAAAAYQAIKNSEAQRQWEARHRSPF